MRNDDLETTEPPYIVGPTKFGSTGQVYIGRYHDGMLALVLLDPKTGEQILCATVCMSATTTYRDREHVWIKDWSENEGIAAALVKARVLTLTGEVTPAGHAIAYEARLTPEFINDLPKPVRDHIKYR